MNIKIPETNHSRREFLKQSCKLGLLCGVACMCPHASSKLIAEEGMGMTGASSVPDPKKLNYCGYTCPEKCPMKLAGESGDVEKKRAAYEKWMIKKRYGLEFDPDKVLCNGCKTETDEMELGVAVSNCPIRKCAIEKKLDCCIECDELAVCDKAPWKEFPQFHERMLELQKVYQSSLA